MRWFLMVLITSAILFSYWLANSTTNCSKTRWWTYYEAIDISGSHQIAMLQSDKTFWYGNQVLLPFVRITVTNGKDPEVAIKLPTTLNGLLSITYQCDTRKPIKSLFLTNNDILTATNPYEFMSYIINCHRLTIKYPIDKMNQSTITFNVCEGDK